MRQIGAIADQRQAQQFTDYLVTQGIAAQTEQEDGQWVIWVRDENNVEAARQELTEFRRQPDATKYRQVAREAQQRRTEEVRRKQQAARNTIDMRGHWNRPMSQRAPLTMTLIGLCCVVALFSQFGTNDQGIVMRTLMMVDVLAFKTTGDGLMQIKQGQLWRLITPVFLHKGVIHLIFNMFWLYYFGTQIEIRRSTLFLGMLVLGCALFSNLLQYFVGQGPLFLGISGVNYGLFGYVWIKRMTDPREPYMLSDGTIMLLLVFLGLGFVPAFAGSLTGGAGIANWAHVGGLMAGAAIAYFPRVAPGPPTA